jgi:hypothetical protein
MTSSAAKQAAANNRMKADVDKINKATEKAIAKMGEGAFRGMLKAGTFIQGESQEIAPHRTGILIGSAFTDSAFTSLGKGTKFIVRVGYTALYAAFVHEMPAKTNWTKPDTGNKFLEKAVKNNIRKIVDFIFKDASKGL